MKKLYVLLIVVLFVNNTQAQISINLTNIEEWVKTNFVGQGVVVGNIKVSLAGKEAAGIFNNSNVLQLNKGLVLSTGDVRRIAGLNDKYNESTGFNISGKPDEDKYLKSIIKGNLFDLSYIEFDFVPYNNSIQFNYQFGSDEYPEFVGSAFNDVFAFLVSDEKETKNIALIPTKNTPVSINTINYKTDSVYFINNNVFALVNPNRDQPKAEEEEVYRSQVGKILFAIKKFFVGEDEGQNQIPTLEPNEELIKKVNDKLYKNLQYDGITTKLAAQTFVEPYKKYHLKIMIADVADNIYDSAVFLEQGSFATIKDITQPGFVDYPDLSQQIDASRILNGEKAEDIYPTELKFKKEPVQKPENTVSPAFNFENVLIFFDFDQSDVKDSEVLKISNIAKALSSTNDQYRIELIGHTDNKGSLAYNMQLSADRNKAVLSCLQSIAPQVKADNFTNKAYLLPSVSNDTDEGRAINRRVEIRFIKIK